MPSSPGQANLEFPNRCEAHKLFPRFISREEAQQTTKPCKKTLINSVSCQAPNLQDFVDEVGGLDFSTVYAKPTMDFSEFARFIPVTHKKIFDLSAANLPFDQIGISLKDVFKSLPKPRYGRVYWSSLRMRENLLKSNIFKNKQRFLFLTGKDLLIESVDQDEIEIGFYDTLAKMGFTLVSAFNFSVFFGECATDHAINQKRSLESFRQLQERGIAAIPHFYWAHEFHSKKILKWLLQQPNVKLISVNCQCFRQVDYPVVEAGLRFLAENTGGRLHFLLEGPKPTLLVRIKDISPLIHVAMKWPVMEAIYHTQLNFADDHIEQIKGTPLPISYLVGHNTREYEKYLKNCFWGGILTKPKISTNKLFITKTKISMAKVINSQINNKRSS